MTTRTYTFSELLDKELAAICAGKAGLADRLGRYTYTPYQGTMTFSLTQMEAEILDRVGAELASPELRGQWALDMAHPA